ncbi:MAG: response regulator [Bacteroidales bacterium]|nr:response regulator [Bacteroidales bacterium]
MKGIWKSGLLVLYVSLFGWMSVIGQREKVYSLVSYSNKEGFDQNTILSIGQGKFGNLWLGTSNGLIKYDGNSFQNISWEPKYQKDIYRGPIRHIHSDNSGLLWIVSRNGLNIYYPDRDKFFKTTSDSMDILFRIVQDVDQSMWVMGDKYLGKVTTAISDDTIITNWSTNILPESHAGLNIRDLLKVSEDLYLLATTTGLYKMFLSDSMKNLRIEREESIPSTLITRSIQYKNLIWIGSAKGLYKTVMDGTTLRLISSYQHNTSNNNSIADNEINDLLIGSDDRLWIATKLGGLSLYNDLDETFTNFVHDPTKRGRLSSNWVNCIFEDPYNVLWIGTGQGGLNKLDLNQKQFINIGHNPYDPKTISSNLVNCILEDSEGYLWITSFNSPLCRSNEPVTETSIMNLTFERFNTRYNNSPGNIISMYEDMHGYIWLGYENGSVVVYNKGNGIFTSLNLISNYDIPTISEIHSIVNVDDENIMLSGSQILILNNPWRYFRSQSQVDLPVDIMHTFDDEREIITVNVEDVNNIWIGFINNGLSRYALEDDSLVLLEHYVSDESDTYSLSNNSVFCIKEDVDEALWVGTFGGGLNKMMDMPGRSSGKFEHFGETIGLINNAFYGIIDENDSILWCGTDMGIYRLNTRSNKLKSYDISDGVASNNFRMNAYHKGRSGNYYFGGLNGLTVFKPGQIKLNVVPPEVRITELRINNKVVPVGEQVDKRIILDRHISEVAEIILTRDARTIGFDIISYHTSVPDKNRLAYYLEGFDDEWIDVNQGSFTPTYTNLESGDYTFRVRGYNGDGVISEEEASLRIIMLAPWFARPVSILFFILLSISIITGISIYLVKLKNLQNKLYFEQIDKGRIQEVNQSKLRFFTNISHEFKTPLSLISIPLSKLKETVKGDEQREYVNMIEKNSNRLIRLMNQLLTFRRIEHGGVELNISETCLDELIYPVAEAFESLSEKKGIHFYCQIKDPASIIHVDLEKMEQVLFNLLSNAFKFTSSGGKIRLEGSLQTIDDISYVSIDVKDSGMGIQREEMDKIFDRFYQTGSELRNMGAGIGLSYSKSIVELHKGTLKVESAPGKGTTFSILQPMNELKISEQGKNEINRINAGELLEYEKFSGSLDANEEINRSLKPVVLIADDESDFRKIIKDVLQKNYKVVEASNGLDAMEITSNEEVDLIISDVMMPGMNGYDFCKNVKSDIQLCHIPFILLTALEEIDSQIQGVEHGADSYISKPFNLKHLEVSVKKLIETREQLKQHFTQSQTLPKDVHLSGIDSAFIELVNKAIQENMENSSFGVEELAKETNLSTSQLYRKLKQLTGQVPSVYLRNYRLQAAADLLSNNPGIIVKTVMYDVGIESASHFSHAFKKKFGHSPSEFPLLK